MLTKKTYRFNFDSPSSHYRVEQANDFKITGFGLIEEYGENGSVEIQIEEDGQRLPMLYEVYLVLGENETFNLGSFSSANENLVKWQTIFSLEDLNTESTSLDQLSSISIQATPQTSDEELIQVLTYLFKTPLSNPEIELLLKDEEISELLEGENSNQQEQTEIMLPTKTEELVTDPEVMQLLQPLDVCTEEEKTENKKTIWKFPEPLNSREEEEKKVKITFS